MALSLYIPRVSPIHRAPAGPKVALLFFAGLVLFFVTDRWVLGTAALISLSLYALARLGWRVALAQLRPALGLLLFFFVFQGLTTSWEAASLTALRFTVMILLAGLLSLTTRTSDLLAALERGLRPLAPLGLDPARVSLACSLAVRFIPVIGQVVRDVQEAQRARGLEQNAVALAVPIIIRTLKMADDIADAIDARS